jgi:hypothetical protein
MRHDTPTLGPLLLYGGAGALISTGNFAAKSTGKPFSTAAGAIKMIPLRGVYGRYGVQVQSASTVATSSFSIRVIGSLSSANPQKLGSSKFTALVTATSANQNGIKFSTSIIPASWVGIASSKFTTAAGRAVTIRLVCVPS